MAESKSCEPGCTSFNRFYKKNPLISFVGFLPGLAQMKNFEDSCKAAHGAAAFQSQAATPFFFTRSLSKLHGHLLFDIVHVRVVNLLHLHHDQTLARMS